MKQILNLLFTICVYCSCSQTREGEITEISGYPDIFPDYVDVTVPYNIAPLNFSMFSSDEEIVAVLFKSKQTELHVKGHKGFAKIPLKKWRSLLSGAKNDSIQITVTSRKEGEILTYRPFRILISAKEIDRYIAYRLIEPLYALWNEMGIYQRDLESFKETAIYTNKLTEDNCVNCHSFRMQSADKMMFHMRGVYNGSVFIDGNDIEFVVPKTKDTPNLVYPSWHPSGRFVAFSINDTYQNLHPTQRIEVYDLTSDIVLYDIKKHSIISIPELSSQTSLETFPTFSPDGKTLYYCSAPALPMPDSIKQLRYNLCSISFEPETKSFGETDTLYNTTLRGGSVSFPRVSPDGKFLMYTLSGYGTFPIWHKDADLYQLNLQDKSHQVLSAANSPEAESYHSWSSNSHWIVFASRRLDGLHTRPFIAYIDENGNPSKPFLVPQERKELYKLSMKSYNIPEFVKERIPVQKATRIARKVRMSVQR